MAHGAPQRATAGATDVLPRRFGRYLLFDRIGRGGMADIYLAQVSTDLGASRRVVVKQILPELSRDEHFSRMFVDEAKLVAGLSHGNVAQVLDLGREGERLFIAMEYVEGYDLDQLLRRLSKRRIPLPAQFALFLVREVLAGLDFAHRAKRPDGTPLDIVHRDVSPSNVLISFEGEVKLCDFGIARAFGSATSTPKRASDGAEEGSGAHPRVVGKAAYMSPEHARGEDLDARSDVFAAGIILWELSAGRRLYKGSEAEMLEMARAGRIPPLPDRGLPEQAALQAILDRALAPNPAERFQSAAEMLRALDDYAMGAKLFVSQLRFGSFLSEHFEADVVRARRERERAAEAVDRGPLVQMVPIAHRRGEELPEEAGDPPSTAVAEPEASVEPASDSRGVADDVTRLLPAQPGSGADRKWLALAAVLAGLAVLVVVAVVLYALMR